MERASNPWRPRPRSLLLIGDSHGAFYAAHRFVDGVLMIPMRCTGGSARGLSNPRSRSRFGSRIEQLLSTLASELPLTALAPCLLGFGQVDVEFVYYYSRLQSGKESFDHGDAQAFLAETVARYGQFLERIASVYRGGTIAVAGIFPPTLNDEHINRGMVNGHIADAEGHAFAELEKGMLRLQFPNLRVRTQMHRDFNGLLEVACRELDLIFVNPFEQLIGEDGLVHPEVIRDHGGTDHHISNGAPRALAASRAAVRELLAAIAARDLSRSSDPRDGGSHAAFAGANDAGEPEPTCSPATAERLDGPRRFRT